MLPFLQSQFPGIVNKVKPVFTFDEDLETVCNTFGFNTTHPLCINQRYPFHKIKKFMLDLHPDIDGFLKVIQLKEYENEDFGMNNIETRKMCIDKYTFKWFMEGSISVILQDGNIARDVNAIDDATHKGIMHPDINCSVEIAERSFCTLEIDNENMFDTKKYVVLE